MWWVGVDVISIACRRLRIASSHHFCLGLCEWGSLLSACLYFPFLSLSGSWFPAARAHHQEKESSRKSTHSWYFPGTVAHGVVMHLESIPKSQGHLICSLASQSLTGRKQEGFITITEKTGFFFLKFHRLFSVFMASLQMSLPECLQSSFLCLL